MERKDLRSAIWIIPYLLGIVIISYLGAFGGLNWIPFGWDFLVMGIFSVVVLYLAVYTRIAMSAEEVADYLTSESAALSGH
jgi:hypothetical protein